MGNLSDNSFAPPSDRRLTKIRKEMKKMQQNIADDDDVLKKPVSAEAYKEVVQLRSSLAMRAWVDKILEGKDWITTDEEKYASLILRHIEKPSDLETLMDDLEKADYIQKPKEDDEQEPGLLPVLEDEPTDSVTETPKGPQGKEKEKEKEREKEREKGNHQEKAKSSHQRQWQLKEVLFPNK